MPDDPIIISGGSLKIKTKDKLTEETGSDPKHKGNYKHAKDNGTLKGVTINGTKIEWKGGDITIHYEVP